MECGIKLSLCCKLLSKANKSRSYNGACNQKEKLCDKKLAMINTKKKKKKYKKNMDG
jgi:hypothetical protein